MLSCITLDERWKARIHWVQIPCIVLAMCLSIGRLNSMTPPPTRANVLSLTMGIKSLIVIAYQQLTEHKPRFHKWASTKANAILNCLEVVFWLTVIIVTGGVIDSETGAATAITVLILLLAIALCFLTAWVAAISIKIRRHGRRTTSTAYVVTDSALESNRHVMVQNKKVNPMVTTA